MSNDKVYAQGSRTKIQYEGCDLVLVKWFELEKWRLQRTFSAFYRSSQTSLFTRTLNFFGCDLDLIQVVNYLILSQFALWVVVSKIISLERVQHDQDGQRVHHDCVFLDAASCTCSVHAFSQP